jgi:hypothetical protein
LSRGIQGTCREGYGYLGGCGLSPVVRGGHWAAQRACGGSQGRLRATRAAPGPPCGQPGSIPAAGGLKGRPAWDRRCAGLHGEGMRESTLNPFFVSKKTPTTFTFNPRGVALLQKKRSTPPKPS